MTTAFAEPDLQDAQATPEELHEALRLHESVSLREAVVRDDGTIVLDLIRPCVGRGKGKHLYTPEMLRENAHNFAGWKMYVDHLSDEAQKKLGGLPRSVRDLGGRVVESFWNDSLPPDPERGFGQGGVQAIAKPVPFVRELVESDPGIVELSINSNATGVRPVIYQGKRVMLVEGIQRKGSIDWVTEAGAGGRVSQLMESVYGDEHAEEVTLLESMDDEALRSYLEHERPDLAEAMKKADDEESGETSDDDEEHEKLVKKFMSNGMPRAAAEKAASKAKAKKAAAVKEGTDGSPDDDEGGEVEITAETLREALETEDGRDTILSVVREVAGDDLRSLVETAVEEERILIRREAQASAERKIELRDMRDEAQRTIRESRLPKPAQERAMAKFEITEGVPSPALDLMDDLDDDGEVTKSASEKLREAVEAEITEQREFVAQISPARVSGQGATRGAGDGEGSGDTEAKPHAVPTRTAAVLKEAGFSDPDEVYAPAE